ncbi:MAG: hypothetical protein U0936_15690 [Planctomycetaceae bacterium]
MAFCTTLACMITLGERAGKLRLLQKKERRIGGSKWCRSQRLPGQARWRMDEGNAAEGSFKTLPEFFDGFDPDADSQQLAADAALQQSPACVVREDFV